MVRLEQAIFTSTETSLSSGYQLAAHSGGIMETDLRGLSAWGPSHDSLWPTGAQAASVNFHALPSGALCVSQTVAAGAEYSGRRGPRLYTQQLIAAPESFAAFGHHPFVLWEAARKQGCLAILERIPHVLDSLWLDTADQPAMPESYLRQADPACLAILVQAALAEQPCGIIPGERACSLVAALFSALPLAWRRTCSFTTGLRFSLRRPFHLICLPEQRLENQRLARQHQFRLLDLAAVDKTNLRLHSGWAAFVHACLVGNRCDLLLEALNRINDEAAEVSSNQPADAALARWLDCRGTQLLSELSGLTQPGDAKEPGSLTKIYGGHDAQASINAGTQAAPGCTHGTNAAAKWRLAHDPHVRGGQLLPSLSDSNLANDWRESLPIDEEPACAMGALCPWAKPQLQNLEDAIFEVVAGKPALAELHKQWSDTLALVGGSLAEKAREKYLGFAVALWRQVNAAGEPGNSQRAACALEVICLLMGK